jgi:hypothetical protein
MVKYYEFAHSRQMRGPPSPDPDLGKKGGAIPLWFPETYLLKCSTFSSYPVTLDPCYRADQDARRAVAANLITHLSQRDVFRPCFLWSMPSWPMSCQRSARGKPSDWRTCGIGWLSISGQSDRGCSRQIACFGPGLHVSGQGGRRHWSSCNPAPFSPGNVSNVAIAGGA